MQPGEKIITRKEAKAAGLKRYFTGKPCKHGHVAERSVSKRACVECERQWYRQWSKDNAAKKQEYYRQWYKDNAEKQREHARKWREANAEYAREYNRQWYKDNAEKKREYRRQWYKDKDNAEKHLECCRRWRKDNAEKYRETKRKWREDNAEKLRETKRKWREDNAEKHREYMRKWHEDNVEKTREYQRHRYAADPTFRLACRLRAMLQYILGGCTGEGALSHAPEGRVEAVRAKIDADLVAIPGAPGSYAEMDGSEWHIDHIVPLSVMIDLLPKDEPRPVLAYVSSHPDMIRPLPAAENVARGNKLDADAKAALPRFWEIVHEARAYHNDRKGLET